MRRSLNILAVLTIIACLAVLGFNRNETLFNYLPSLLKGQDKILHLVGFGLLTFSVYWIWRRSLVKNMILTLAIMVTCSFLSEAIQGALPIDRAFDILDVWANLEGVTIGLILAMCIDQAKRNISKPRDFVDLEEVMELIP